MTRTTRLRRITLHFSHIGLTLGRTFIGNPYCQLVCCCDASSLSHIYAPPETQPVNDRCRSIKVAQLACCYECWGTCLLIAVGDSPAGEIVRCELNLDLVTGKDADVVAPHLSRDMAQYVMTILELDPEHGVRERLGDGAFEHDRIFFMLWQGRCLSLRDSRRRNPLAHYNG